MAISFDTVAGRVREALRVHRPRAIEADGFRHAAVLVPVLSRANGPTVLFTRRSESMTHHRGQISFPGGRSEPGESARSAALREAHEEIALAPELVEVAGGLDEQPSVAGFVVSPFVGLVAEPPPRLVAQAGEVEELFEVPLAVLLDRDRHRVERWRPSRLPPDAPAAELERLGARSGDFDPETGRYRVHFFDASPHSRHEIWGLTARILNELLERAFRPVS